MLQLVNYKVKLAYGNEKNWETSKPLELYLSSFILVTISSSSASIRHRRKEKEIKVYNNKNCLWVILLCCSALRETNLA